MTIRGRHDEHGPGNDDIGRAELREVVKQSIEGIDRQVSSYALNEYYDKAFNFILSGRAKRAFDLGQEPDAVRDKYGRHTFGQSLLLSRRLIEAGTRFVQINWPAVANGDPMTEAWDCHYEILHPVRDLHAPKLDSGLSSLVQDLDERGMLEDTLVVWSTEFGRMPFTQGATGRDHNGGTPY